MVVCYGWRVLSSWHFLGRKWTFCYKKEEVPAACCAWLYIHCGSSPTLLYFSALLTQMVKRKGQNKEEGKWESKAAPSGIKRRLWNNRHFMERPELYLANQMITRSRLRKGKCKWWLRSSKTITTPCCTGLLGVADYSFVFVSVHDLICFI